MLSFKSLPFFATLAFSFTSTFAAPAPVHATLDRIAAREAPVLLRDEAPSIPDILQGVIDQLGPLAGALGGIDPSNATTDGIGGLVSEIEGIIQAGIDAVGGDGGDISFFDVLEFAGKVGEFVNTLFDAIGSVLDKTGSCDSSSDTADDSNGNCSGGTTDLLSALANLAGELISTMLGGGAGGGISLKTLVKVALPLVGKALPVIERLGVGALLKIFKL